MSNLHDSKQSTENLSTASSAELEEAAVPEISQRQLRVSPKQRRQRMSLIAGMLVVAVVAVGAVVASMLSKGSLDLRQRAAATQCTVMNANTICGSNIKCINLNEYGVGVCEVEGKDTKPANPSAFVNLPCAKEGELPYMNGKGECCSGLEIDLNTPHFCKSAPPPTEPIPTCANEGELPYMNGKGECCSGLEIDLNTPHFCKSAPPPTEPIPTGTSYPYCTVSINDMRLRDPEIPDEPGVWTKNLTQMPNGEMIVDVTEGDKLRLSAEGGWAPPEKNEYKMTEIAMMRKENATGNPSEWFNLTRPKNINVLAESNPVLNWTASLANDGKDTASYYFFCNNYYLQPVHPKNSCTGNPLWRKGIAWGATWENDCRNPDTVTIRVKKKVATGIQPPTLSTTPACSVLVNGSVPAIGKEISAVRGKAINLQARTGSQASTSVQLFISPFGDKAQWLTAPNRALGVSPQSLSWTPTTAGKYYVVCNDIVKYGATAGGTQCTGNPWCENGSINCSPWKDCGTTDKVILNVQ